MSKVQMSNGQKSNSSSLTILMQPESLLSSWTGTSFVLMTTSLLFYHMTRIASIEMNPRVAGGIAVTMIILAIAFELQALVIYKNRCKILQNAGANNVNREEQHVTSTYIATISSVVLVQIYIAYIIIKGSFRKSL